MPNNKLIDNGSNPDFTLKTEEVAGVDTQLVGLEGPGGVRLPGEATNGLDVDVTRNAPLVAGTAIVGKFYLTDGTDDATISVAGSRKPLDVHLIDAAGAVISSFGGAGGTSAADNSAFTAGTTVATPVAGFYQSTPSAVTDGRVAALGMTVNRELKVSLTDTTLDVDHDTADSGRPVKTGARAINAFPTAVANNDRANSVADLFGRQLVSHIDPAMQIWKSANYTTLQTGTVIWDPAAGKKIAITHLQVNSYGTTAGRIILFFNTTTTYTEGTHQPVFKGKHSPSATSTPGALPPITFPLFSATVDAELRCTTDAGISLDVVVYGYEI